MYNISRLALIHAAIYGFDMWAAAWQATEEKNAAVAQADKTLGKARLAERLISGLAGEFQRWSKNIEDFAAAEGLPQMSA